MTQTQHSRFRVNIACSSQHIFQPSFCRFLPFQRFLITRTATMCTVIGLRNIINEPARIICNFYRCHILKSLPSVLFNNWNKNQVIFINMIYILLSFFTVNNYIFTLLLLNILMKFSCTNTRVIVIIIIIRCWTRTLLPFLLFIDCNNTAITLWFIRIHPSRFDDTRAAVQYSEMYEKCLYETPDYINVFLVRFLHCGECTWTRVQ